MTYPSICAAVLALVLCAPFAQAADSAEHCAEPNTELAVVTVHNALAADANQNNDLAIGLCTYVPEGRHRRDPVYRFEQYADRTGMFSPYNCVPLDKVVARGQTVQFVVNAAQAARLNMKPHNLLQVAFRDASDLNSQFLYCFPTRLARWLPDADVSHEIQITVEDLGPFGYACEPLQP